MLKQTLFISDLHLEPSRPEITALFINFLEQQATQAEALYILGDFFEAWIGDDDQSTLNQTVKAALKILTQNNIPVYFMHGNRDFLIGKQFAQETGCRLLPDPTKIDLYGIPTLLMHGDLLCTQDQSYLKFRTKVHKRWAQKIFLTLPLTIRKKIATKIRQGSEQHISITNEKIMDVTPAEVDRIMAQYQVKQLIHGHTHRPNIHHLQQGHRIVLGAWHNSGSILICEPGQPPKLQNIFLDK